MDLNIVRSRINQVFMVDSINSSDADFLATHIPFKNISLRYGVNKSILESINEENAFYKLFKDPNILDKHQLVVVEGSSGSGKSHFIRWLYAKLKSDGNDSDEVLLIRRSDNTLKGTIKQLLSIDAVKNLKNKDIYERLVRANNTISDKKFNDEIYYKFIVEIENSEEDILSSVEKKRLSALLSDASFKEKLLDTNGPIERIFSKISSNYIGNEDVIPQFFTSDFLIDTDFYEQLKDIGAKDAQRLAKNLISDVSDDDLIKRITDFMNKLVDPVIQNCAGIEPGDFQQIFKEIRQELKLTNKNLILLIEDITSFTGINQALLNALITEHTGINESDKMCKLVSVIGTTSEYYKDFRDNYKDRITSQITIADGTIGQDNNDLYMFFAKYLNAVSIDEKQIKDWYINNGADPKSLPICDTYNEWDSIEYYGRKLSLYPFTKRAINSMYNNMEEHKTPRYILREIIEPIVNELINDNNTLFYYLRNKSLPLNDNQKTRIGRTIDELKLTNDIDVYKKRAICFIAHYGNGNLEKNGNKIAGIDKKIYDAFGFSDLYNKLEQTVALGVDIIPEEDNEEMLKPSTKSKAILKEDTNYRNFKNQLDSWFDNNQIFVNPRYVLEELNNIIVSSINWQQYSISNQIISMISSQVQFNLLSFERQEKNEDSSIYKLPSTKETYELLRVIGQWYYLGNKSWRFEESTDAILILTSWIENNKNKIINNIKKKFENKTPTYIKIALLNEIYRRILNGDFNVNSLDSLMISDLISKYDNINKNSNFNQFWIELNNLINDDDNGKLSYSTIFAYFNLTQGSGTSKTFLNYIEFEKLLKELKKDKFIIDTNDYNPYFTVENNLLKSNLAIEKRLNKIINKQFEISNNIIQKIYLNFGWDVSVDIDASDYKEFINEIKDFYYRCEQIGAYVTTPTSIIEKVENAGVEIIKNINKIKDLTTDVNIYNLFMYSKINYDLLRKFLDLLDKVNEDLNSITPTIDEEYSKLIRNGKCIEKDPRFESEKSMYETLKSEMEVMFNE